MEEKREKEIEKTLLDLLRKYHHFKFMRAGFFSFSWYAKMNLGDFMEWLKSRDR